MKISQVSIGTLKTHANCFHNLDDVLFDAILIAGKQFLVSYTGKTLMELDDHEDLTIALLIIATEMYDNRAVHVEFPKLGFVIRQLLDAHSINLL